ncbi:MAG: hypothetical protein ABSC02_00240 [Acidobacteriota bacterium]|jgi:hypothetical protein
MIQRLASAAVFLTLFAGLSLAQENPFSKNFKFFKKDVAPGIDYFAENQNDIEPYIKPVVEARAKIGDFLGKELSRGAIFVCSTVAQKDAVYDVKVFKSGYKWYLIQLTPEGQREERTARQQAAGAQRQAAASAGQDQGGGQDQAGRRGGGQRGGQDQANQRGGGQRGGQDQGGRGGMGNPSPEMRAAQEARAAGTLAMQMGYATLMTTLDDDLYYRVSRVEDVGKSPLVDWLDIGLVAYATGTSNTYLKFLQDNLESAFAIEDVLSMNRPFVVQQDSGSGAGAGGGNPGMAMMGGGDRGQAGGGGRSGAGGGRGNAPLPKDVQDRQLFDGQAATFFNYLIEKLGIDKAKEVVRQNMQGKQAITVVESFLGSNFDKVDSDWQAWVKTLKPPDTGRMIPQNQTGLIGR